MNETATRRPALASERPRPDVLDEYDVHPVAALWPLIGEADAQELARDILEHGQKEPIWMFRGQVIDGRNRLVACDMAGVKPRFEEWEPAVPGETPVTFILSKNLHRRHLSASVKATVAVQVEEWLIAERERLAAEQSKIAANFTAPPSDEEAPAAPAAPQGSVEALFGLGSPAADTAAKGKSMRVRDQAAKIVGVAAGYVNDAKDIRRASPETFEKVASGELTIPKAQEALVDMAQREGTLHALGLRPGVKRAAEDRLREREARKDRPQRPAVKIKKFSRVESSRVEVTIKAEFGSPAKAEQWLERMADEKSILGLTYEVEGGDGEQKIK